jgi:hypothetical protein
MHLAQHRSDTTGRRNRRGRPEQNITSTFNNEQRRTRQRVHALEVRIVDVLKDERWRFALLVAHHVQQLNYVGTAANALQYLDLTGGVLCGSVCSTACIARDCGTSRLILRFLTGLSTLQPHTCWVSHTLTLPLRRPHLDDTLLTVDHVDALEHLAMKRQHSAWLATTRALGTCTFPVPHAPRPCLEVSLSEPISNTSTPGSPSGPPT